jgi:hypothetical protein
MSLHADCNVTVKPLYGQWYWFLTVLNTEIKKIYKKNNLTKENQAV